MVRRVDRAGDAGRRRLGSLRDADLGVRGARSLAALRVCRREREREQRDGRRRVRAAPRRRAAGGRGRRAPDGGVVLGSRRARADAERPRAAVGLVPRALLVQRVGRRVLGPSPVGALLVGRGPELLVRRRAVRGVWRGGRGRGPACVVPDGRRRAADPCRVRERAAGGRRGFERLVDGQMDGLCAGRGVVPPLAGSEHSV